MPKIYFLNATPQKDIKYNHYWFVFKEESIMGYKKSQPLFKDFSRIFHWESQQRFKDQLPGRE